MDSLVVTPISQVIITSPRRLDSSPTPLGEPQILHLLFCAPLVIIVICYSLMSLTSLFQVSTVATYVKQWRYWCVTECSTVQIHTCLGEPSGCLHKPSTEPDASSWHTPTPLFCTLILIFFFHQNVYLPSDLFPSGFVTKVLYAFLALPLHAAHPVLTLGLHTQILFDVVCKSWGSSLYCYLSLLPPPFWIQLSFFS